MGSARIYKAYSPYPHTAVGNLDYAQTADVVYAAHLDYPVYKATRTNHTSWTFAPVPFGPKIAVPATPTITAATPNTTGYTGRPYTYLITAIGGANGQESRPSTTVSVTNDLTLANNSNTITFPTKPTGVDRYIVYKASGGGYGYIGGSDGTTFVDGNPQILPILSDTPPVATNPFDVVGKYPSTVTFHEQRLLLGGTRLLPNGVWGSQSADFENMDVSHPSKPDDALSFALVAERVNSVNQLVSMPGGLVTMTSDSIFSVSGGQDTPLTPNSILPKRQGGRGGSRLNPIVLDEIMFYFPAKGNSIRTLGYKFEVDGYQSNNVAIFSPHLFKGFNISSWAYVEEPFSAIFAVRNDGVLLCFTWEAEQQVWGWTVLDTPGRVLEVQVITEGGYDRLYLLVERSIGGVVRRFHERMALPHLTDIATACHLDCSVTQVYNPARNVIDGLRHLEGTAVSAYYDGYVAHDLPVINGSIILPNGYAATITTVGLRYSGEIETLPMVLQTSSGSAHINEQNIARVVMRAVDTRGVQIGITGTVLEAIVEREGGEVGLDDVAARDYDVTPRGSWKSSTTLSILQAEPLPAHITGLFIDPVISRK